MPDTPEHPPNPPSDSTPTPAAHPSPDVAPATDAAPSPQATPTRARPGRRTVLTAALPAAAAVVGLTALTAPRPAGLGEPVGDQRLTAALAPRLEGHRRVAAVLVEGGQVRLAGFGTGDGAALESSEFETGSVTKTFTGALLALAIERGEVALTTTVGEVLGEEAEGSAISDVTFAELATHTSGLPRLGPSSTGKSLLDTFLRKNPYQGRDVEHVLDGALGATPSGRGEKAYSNLGAALQGQLLARVAGTDYSTLLAERVLEPLGMPGSYAPATAENLRETARRGHSATGHPQAMWAWEGYAPAGDVRSTPADMARCLTAMIDGSAPGASAATEVLDRESETSATAMNWFLDDFGNGRPITWHNGMTGGYSAFLGWDPSAGRGLALLSDSSHALDELAVGVLIGEVAL
jgi:CubicO group peptidase (beta-lactamase class C family)